MERKQIQEQPNKQERKVEDIEETPVSSVDGEKVKAELDDLLDEIDGVLETNAEDFVKAYVQKGGQ